MNPTQFWKNFNLNAELHISGNFIYAGLNNLDKVDHFENKDEVFEILYNLSVGFERLLKIPIILIEHKPSEDQDDFEESLITHNHLVLLERLQKSVELNLSNPHKSLLHILARFYKKFRYDRYCLGSVFDDEKELAELRSFLSHGLNADFSRPETMFVSYNTFKGKKYIGKICGKIAKELYSAIKDAARNIHLYTYEIRTDSKAYKIFIREEYDFFNESIAWKELLIAFIKAEHPPILDQFLNEFDPVKIDPYDLLTYIDSFHSDIEKTKLIDLMEVLYEDLPNVSKRIDLLNCLNSDLAMCGSEEEDEDEY